MMELCFAVRVHHSSVVEAATGQFICEFDEDRLASGAFQFSGYEVKTSQIDRLIETSLLTKGRRLREHSVRFVCVLKASESVTGADFEEDERYFCATINRNGWQLLTAILDKHEV